MNPKIMKTRNEIKINAERITKLQAKNGSLEKKLREMENTEILGLVQERKLTLEQVIALLNGNRNAIKEEKE